jgi:hypothetical protein
MAYVTSVPFTVLMNQQEQGATPEFFDIKLENGAIPVYFDKEPEYTTAPVKITGKLTKVKTYDDVNYISYEYAITEASYSNIESYKLGIGFKEFVAFARMGYLDVAYQNILQLEMFSYDYLKDFPEEKEYASIMSDMQEAPDFIMYEEYVEIIEQIHATYELYKEQLSTKGSIDKADVMFDANALVKRLIEFVDKYASFKLVNDKEAGYYKLESANVVFVDDTEQSTEPTESTNTEATEGPKSEK